MKRELQLPTEFPWRQETKFRDKLRKGFIHWIVKGTDFDYLDTVQIKFGKIVYSERKAHNVIPVTAYWDKAKKVYQVLINHQCVTGMELYRLIIGCGLTTGKFEKMLQHWTNDGKKLFIGQLVVWSTMDSAFPYVPYVLKNDSRRVANEIKAASKLLYRIDRTEKGKGLISPVLAYEFLTRCEFEGLELNFHQSVEGGKESVFIIPYTDKEETGLSINPNQKECFFPTRKRPIDLVTEKLRKSKFVKS